MGEKVAIIICNYNKKDHLLNCIASVKELNNPSFDLFVVDNASVDGSVKAVEDSHRMFLTLIKNHENLGGSGGFNSGIRKALKMGYRYLYLLDNDIILDRNALIELYNYLENHLDVGIAGSAIYSMDKPEELQELGANIDWENYSIKPKFKGHIDNGQLPTVTECDYVPACSMLVRADVIREVGLMDEGNFIYWDDIEWGYRFKKAGYKVVAISASKVWHKMGAAAKVNTFGTYYFWRNRVHFFVKYSDENTIQRFADQIFYETFQALYTCNFNGKHNSARTIMTALEDACNNIRGKAPAGRIMELERVEPAIERLLSGKQRVLLIDCDDIKILRDIVNKIMSLGVKELVLSAKENSVQDLQVQFPNLRVEKYEYCTFEGFDLVCQACYHIFEQHYHSDEKVDAYIDRFLNVVSSSEDLNYAKNYHHTYEFFRNTFYPLFLDKLLLLKERLEKEHERC